MGNSAERVILKDLNDVIYYKQVKEITDQERELSKDLDRELKKGRIVILEKNTCMRGSEDTLPHVFKNENQLPVSIDIKGAVREIAPLIIDAVRQELSKISTFSGTVSPASMPAAQFQDPSYVPTVTTVGMVSNIEAKKKEVSSAGAEDALAILRKLKSK